MRLAGRLRILQKLWIIVGIAIIGMILLGALASMEIHESLLADRKIKTRHVVETAYQVIQYFGEQAKTGKMTKEAAQQQAVEAVKGLRYGKNEYFWINDMHPAMVMHPYKPQLDGQDVSDFGSERQENIYFFRRSSER